MNHLFYTLLLTGILMGCSKTTTMIASWKRPDFVAKKYQKLGVVVFSPRMSSRAIVETDMAYEFRVRGVKAIGTFDVFPFAGRRAKAYGDQKAQQKANQTATQATEELMNNFKKAFSACMTGKGYTVQ